MDVVKTAKSLSKMVIKPLKKDRWKKYDTIIGLMMTGLVFFTFGGYSHFTAPSCACGVIFLILQRYLHANWQIPPCRWISGFLRFFAVLWLIFLIPTVFDFGRDKPWIYGVKKSLYIAGNYTERSDDLDFLPDKIPDCENYYARFGAPMAGQDAQGWVKISFKTDAAGIDYLRSQAEIRSGSYYRYPVGEERDETDSNLLSRLDNYAGFTVSGSKSGFTPTDIYTFTEEVRSSHKSCYLLNAETGEVMLNW